MAQEKVETCTITMLSRNPSQELLMRSSISVESATIATGEPARQNNSHRLSSATGGVNPLLLAREHREREPGTGVRWTSECTLGQELDF